MASQNDDTFSSLNPQDQEKSVENVSKEIEMGQGNIRAADSKANFLGTGSGTLAIAAATLVGSSPDNFSNLLKGLLLMSALFLMTAVVSSQIAVYPRTKGMNKNLSKEDLNKRMLSKNTTTFRESKYNRLLDECHYLKAYILPIKNKWIKISIWLGWIGVSALTVAIVSWMVTLIV